MNGIYAKVPAVDIYVFENEEEMNATKFDKENAIIFIGSHAERFLEDINRKFNLDNGR